MSGVWVVSTDGGAPPSVPSNGHCRSAHPFKNLACELTEGHDGSHVAGVEAWATNGRWCLSEAEIRGHFELVEGDG